MKSLQQQVLKIIQSHNAKVGVSASHPSSGFSLSINETEYFPMASTFKLPLAIFCLTKVDQKQLSLHQMIEIMPSHICGGSGIMVKHLDLPGATFSLQNLIRLMMEASDNSATDIILDLCGGAKSLNRWLAEIGIEEISVKSTCRELVERETHVWISPFDHATPKGMTALLHKLLHENILKEESKRFLLNSMSQCVTGVDRIRKFLPAETFVADKTGSIGTIAADVAIVELPAQRGKLLIACYVDSPLDLPEKEHLIAKISQTIFEGFP